MIFKLEINPSFYLLDLLKYAYAKNPHRSETLQQKIFQKYQTIRKHFLKGQRPINVMKQEKYVCFFFLLWIVSKTMNIYIKPLFSYSCKIILTTIKNYV